MSRTRKTAAKAAPAKTETKAKAVTAPAKGLSLLSAAIEVLKESDEPLNCKRMIELAKERGLWTPGAGKTPEQIKADTERDHWLSAEEAKEYGLIDQVLYQR